MSLALFATIGLYVLRVFTSPQTILGAVKGVAATPTAVIPTATPARINEAQAELAKKVIAVIANVGGLVTSTPTPTLTPTLSPTPTVTPIIDTPTPSPTVPFSYPAEFQAQLVALFADQIRNNCIQDGIIGRITNDNSICLNNVKMPPVDASVLDKGRVEMKESASTNYHLQCVKFVNASALITTGYLPLKNGKIPGNAIDYAYNVPDNYTFHKVKDGDRLEPGDMVVYNYETYGHIAYVIKIFDDNTFQVAESNFDAHGTVERNRIDTKDNPNLLGWLRYSPPNKIP